MKGSGFRRSLVNLREEVVYYGFDSYDYKIMVVTILFTCEMTHIFQIIKICSVSEEITWMFSTLK